MSDLELTNCKETCKRLMADNQHLLHSLENAQIRLAEIERSKFRIKEIIQVSGEYYEILQIDNVYSTPDGVLVEVL